MRRQKRPPEPQEPFEVDLRFLNGEGHFPGRDNMIDASGHRHPHERIRPHLQTFDDELLLREIGRHSKLRVQREPPLFLHQRDLDVGNVEGSRHIGSPGPRAHPGRQIDMMQCKSKIILSRDDYLGIHESNGLKVNRKRDTREHGLGGRFRRRFRNRRSGEILETDKDASVTQDELFDDKLSV